MNGRGTRSGTAASANMRGVEAESAELRKPSWDAPSAASPNGTIGRTSGTGRFFAAFESGGGRASTSCAAARAAPLSMAARTSGLGEERLA